MDLKIKIIKRRKSLTYLFVFCLLMSVSVLFPKSVSAAEVSWTGGSGAWETGGNWSGASPPGADDNVTIDATVTVTINATTTINSLTLGGSNSPTLNFGYDAIAGTALIVDDEDLTVNSGATITHAAATSGDIIVGKVSIDVQTGSVTITGTIDVSQKGYIGGNSGNPGTDGNGPGNGTGGQTGGGGGYGGTGGWGETGGTGGSPYGSLTAPTHLGSGGGGGRYGGGGKAGGAVKIVTAGTLTVDGQILADGIGVYNATRAGGGGSGGSIHLDIGSFAGGGTINALGGLGYVGGQGTSGSGSGGRIAITYTGTNTYSGGISVAAGAGGRVGTAGTAFIENTTNNNLYIQGDNGTWSASDRGSWSFNDLTIGGSITFQPTSQTLFTITSTGTTTLPSNATITINSSKSTDNDGVGVHLNLTGNVTIPSTTVITADLKGYAAGAESNPGTDGSGTGGGGGGQTGGGAGYGGTGGAGESVGAAGITYGSLSNPMDLGSGGGGGRYGNGGKAGGAVKITASGILTVAGQITADGTGVYDATRAGGGGSGGSIYLVVGTLVGSGTIGALGGNGYVGGQGTSGNGGGGRIAINYSISDTFYDRGGGTGTVSVAAGTGGRGGAAGTIYTSIPKTFDSSGNSYHGELVSITESSWVKGKFGSALDFDGSADYVSVTDTSTLDLLDGAITYEAWFKTSATSYDSEYGGIVAKRTGSNAGYRLRIGDGSSHNKLVGSIYDGTNQATVTSSSAPNDGNWHHGAVTIQKDSSGNWKLELFLDGISQGTDTMASGNTVNSAEPLRIGKADADDQRYFDGQIDDVRIYNYAHTPGQIVEDMNAGHPLGGSPIASQVGYWSFDEQSGQTVNDKGMGGNNGTRGANSSASSDDPTWKLENDCKVNGCLDFDGSADYVTVGDGSALDLGDDLTLSAWFKVTVLPTSGNNSTIIAKMADVPASSPFQHYALKIKNVSGTTRLRAYNGDLTTPELVDSSVAIVTDTWYHTALTWDGSTRKLYLNGQELTSDTPSGNVGSSNNNLHIGAIDDGSPGEFFDGVIDEVKIYSAALTADEILIDMNAGASAAFGGILGTSEFTGIGGTAPVGYWPMNENTGTTTTYDFSGNDNDGTLNSITESSWVRGVYGNALYFDGTADYVSVGDINQNAYTFSTWFKSDSDITYSSSDDTTALVTFVDGAGHNLDIWVQLGAATATCTDEVITIMDTLNNKRTCVTGSSLTITAGWNHLAISWNSSASRYDIYLNGAIQTVTAGSGSHVGLIDVSGLSFAYKERSPDYFSKFYMDEIKIYNYALSQAQIAYEYNRGKPVGWWKFDECQGTTAYDSAKDVNGDPVGNDGAIVPAAGTNTSAGTCSSGAGDEMWDNGTTGKINYSLDFDGADDFVSISDNALLDITNNITIAAWIKPATFPSNSTILVKPVASDADPYRLYALMNNGTSGNLRFSLSTGSASSQVSLISDNVLSTTDWTHVTATFDGTTMLLYENGVQVKSGTGFSGNTIGTNDVDVDIGGNSEASGQEWDGQIDDVRIYNYSLTNNQVKIIMNQSAQSFGPATGAP